MEREPGAEGRADQELIRHVYSWAKLVQPRRAQYFGVLLKKLRLGRSSSTAGKGNRHVCAGSEPLGKFLSNVAS
jgi:hypothetical protein